MKPWSVAAALGGIAAVMLASTAVMADRSSKRDLTSVAKEHLSSSAVYTLSVPKDGNTRTIQLIDRKSKGVVYLDLATTRARRGLRHDVTYKVSAVKGTLQLTPAAGGAAIAIPVTDLRPGIEAARMPGCNECCPNNKLSGKTNRVKVCCSTDANGNCSSEKECKQDVDTCVGPDGGAYTATGAQYSCTACSGAGGSEPAIVQGIGN
jgi:hypothetical protein